MQNMTETPSEMNVATACTDEKRLSDPSLSYWRVSPLHHRLLSLTMLPIRETTTVFKDSPDVTASSVRSRILEQQWPQTKCDKI